MSRFFDAGPLEQPAPVYSKKMPPAAFGHAADVAQPRAPELPMPFYEVPVPVMTSLPEASRYQPRIDSVEIPKMTSKLELYCTGKGPKECRFCAMRAATNQTEA